MPIKRKTVTETQAAAEPAAPIAAKKPGKPRVRASQASTKTSPVRRKSAAVPANPVAAAEWSPLSSDPLDQILLSGVSEQEQIALLAYRIWESRGCQGGSPEEDWFQAEQQLRSRRVQSSAV